MAKEEQLIAECTQLISTTNQEFKEEHSLKNAIEFALNEWQTNQHWFREESGHVTVPDVIKACVTFGWNSKRQYDYDKNRIMASGPHSDVVPEEK